MTKTIMPDADPAEQAKDRADAQDAGTGQAPAAELEALRAEVEQLRADNLREHAELDNQRKRLEREARTACRYANRQLFSGLLPVFDSLEAALASADADAGPMRDGMVLTLRELSRVAESNGLVEIAPMAGDTFDPERHQAMSVMDSPHVAPGAVAQLFQKGYQLHEQLLRPALVAVAPHEE